VSGKQITDGVKRNRQIHAITQQIQVHKAIARRILHVDGEIPVGAVLKMDFLLHQ
jgi:hypothetical protein